MLTESINVTPFLRKAYNKVWQSGACNICANISIRSGAISAVFWLAKIALILYQHIDIIPKKEYNLFDLENQPLWRNLYERLYDDKGNL